MANTPPEIALRDFLCGHFSQREIMDLALGVLEDGHSRLDALPPIKSVPLADWIADFLDLLRRHGLLDDEFFRGLCAARPMLIPRIRELWAGARLPIRGEPTRRRLRICVEADYDAFPPELLALILDEMRRLGGDPRLIIESVTPGSVLLVVRTSERRKLELLNEQLLARLPFRVEGVLLTNVAMIAIEPRPFAPRASERGPSVVHVSNGNIHAPVGESMRPLPATLSPDDGAAHALERMQRDGVSFAPVVDHSELLGLVYLRDLVARSPADLGRLNVDVFMHGDPTTATPWAPISLVLRQLLRTRQEIAIIVDRGRMVGYFGLDLAADAITPGLDSAAMRSNGGKR